MRKITRSILTLAVTAALLASFAGASFAAETKAKAKEAPQITRMGNPNCPGLKQGHMQGMGNMMQGHDHMQGQGHMMQNGGGSPMMGTAGAATKA